MSARIYVHPASPEPFAHLVRRWYDMGYRLVASRHHLRLIRRVS